MMTNDEITEHLLSNPGSLKDDDHEELARLRQFHADIVAARHGWWKDECSWEADERYIEAIYQALLKHNPDFEG